MSSQNAAERDRQRLARALSDFWYGGAGPTHDEIYRVFDGLDLNEDVAAGSKRDRVYAAVTGTPENKMTLLVSGLIELLSEGGHLTDDDGSPASGLDLLVKRLRPFGLRVTDDGEVLGGTALGVEPETMLDLPALREHIRRIQLALANDDSALLLGASKELLETTSKFVLGETGKVPPDKFPALLAQALTALGMHPKVVSGEDDLSAATKRILGGLQQIGIGVNDLRNDYGTGHGRIGGVRLSLRHARLAAGSAVVLATAMVDTLEDPKAPWRKTQVISPN